MNMAHSDEMIRELYWLRRLAARLVGPGADADDLTQETLRVALEGGARKGAGVAQHRLRPWLTGIARRLALVGWRDDARRRWREADAAPREVLPSAADAVASAEARNRLVEAVLGLDEPLRAAVVLRYLEGLSYVDVAQQLGLKQAAARQRVSRGGAALREELAAAEGRGRSGAGPAWLSAFCGAQATGPELKTPSVALPAALIMQLKTKWILCASLVVLVGGALGWRVLFPTGAGPAPSMLSAMDERATAPFVAPLDTHGAPRLAAAPTKEAALEASEEPDSLPASVSEGDVRVRVIDTNGRPIRGAEVALRTDWRRGFDSTGFDRYEGGPVALAEFDAESDTYRAEVAKGITHVVRAAAPGFGARSVYGVYFDQEVEIVLERAARFHCTVCSRANGMPIAGAQVRVAQRLEHSDHLTNERGEVLVEGIAPGPGAFFVAPPHHLVTRYTEVEFVAEEVLTRTVEVDEGWTVSGQVRLAETGAAVADVEVSDWGFEGRTVRTDARGFYEIRGVKERPGSIVARAEGFGVAESYYRGSREDLDLLLVPAMTMVGRLVDSDGKGISDGLVGHVQWVADAWIPAACEEDGTFRIEGLSAGRRTTMVARAPGLAAKKWTQDLPGSDESPGALVDLGDISMLPAAKIEGRVRWASGAPAEVAVSAQRVDPGAGGANGSIPAVGSLTGTDGRFRILEIQGGLYEVSLQPGIGISRSQRVEVQAGRPHEPLDWVLPDGFLVEGRVLDAEGEPVPHAFVNIRRPGNERQAARHTRTDDLGAFRFEHFESDVCEVYVNCDEDTVRRTPRTAELLPVTLERELGGGAIEIVLRAARTPVSGRVLSADGGPVPLAYVCRNDGKGIRIGGVLTDAQGRFGIFVDGHASTRLSAWATEPFDATTERANLTGVSTRIKREVIGQWGEPLAEGVYPPPAGDPARADSGPRIVID